VQGFGAVLFEECIDAIKPLGATILHKPFTPERFPTPLLHDHFTALIRRSS